MRLPSVSKPRNDLNKLIDWLVDDGQWSVKFWRTDILRKRSALRSDTRPWFSVDKNITGLSYKKILLTASCIAVLRRIRSRNRNCLRNSVFHPLSSYLSGQCLNVLRNQLILLKQHEGFVCRLIKLLSSYWPFRINSKLRHIYNNNSFKSVSRLNNFTLLLGIFWWRTYSWPRHNYNQPQNTAYPPNLRSQT